MRTLRLYVGEGFWSARFIRDELTNGRIDGATIIPAKGHWRNPEGNVVSESAEVLVFVVDGLRDASLLIARAVLHMTDHTSEQTIMIEYGDGSVTFYDREDPPGRGMIEANWEEMDELLDEQDRERTEK